MKEVFRDMANNPNNFMVVQNSTDESQLLGKFLYYSLADVLVKKEDFERICNALDFPYAGRRISVVDAVQERDRPGDAADGRRRRRAAGDLPHILPRQHAGREPLFP